MLKALIRREFRCAWRKRVDRGNALLFFVMFCALFPLAITPDPVFLRRMAPGVILIAALLSALLGLEHLFSEDWRDGSLEQLALLPYPFALLLFVKVICHGVMGSLPLMLILPLIVMWFALPLSSMVVMVLVLLCCMPALSFIGAVAAALTLRLRKGSTLLSLLTLPLYIPTLILAATTLQAGLAAQPMDANLALLLAISVGCMTLMPMFIAAALRIHLQ